MKEKNKRIIIWQTKVVNLIEGRPIGGIAVQMYFWAKIFAENGWKVYSFASSAKETIAKDNIVFKPIKKVQRINLLLEWWYSFKFLMTIRPKLVIYRGAHRQLLPLSIFAKLFGVKLIYFAASDVNFEPGKELVGSEFNRKLYHLSIKHIQYFVTQNRHQHETLLQNYGKKSLTLFNIWRDVNTKEQKVTLQSDVVWVANFRRLKQAEWVMDAAEELPEYHFVLAGGPTGDKTYYDDMQNRAQGIANVKFLGAKSFFFTNALVARSRVLLCTSTFEGFPNTFLQAWSNGLPVISTVDPSGIIAANGLGEVVKTKEDLYESLKKILSDKNYYNKLRLSVSVFFSNNHEAQLSYEKLLNYLCREKNSLLN